MAHPPRRKPAAAVSCSVPWKGSFCFSCYHRSTPGRHQSTPGGIFLFGGTPGGSPPPWSKAIFPVNIHKHTRLRDGKRYEQAFKEQRPGGEDKKKHAWVASDTSDTNRKGVLNHRVYPGCAFAWSLCCCVAPDHTGLMRLTPIVKLSKKNLGRLTTMLDGTTRCRDAFRDGRMITWDTMAISVPTFVCE